MRLLASFALLVTLAAPSIARAHGGQPQTQAIYFAPDDPDRIVATATFGIVTSDDGGATWSWLCQEAIPDAVPGIVQPGVLAAGDRLLLAGTFGLVRSEHAGCAWEREPALVDRYVADVVRSPDGTILALTGDSDGVLENGLFASHDEGLGFARIGASLPAGFLAERVRVAPSDPRWIYVSGQRFIEGTTMIRGVLLSSSDGGDTWSEHAFDAASDERVVRIGAVDPSDPGVAWIVVQGSEHDRLLRASGGGATIEEITVAAADPMPYFRPFALAIASDGTVWFGNTRSGLLSVSAGIVDLVDKYLNVACAAARGDDVWLCANGGDDGFSIGHMPVGVPYAPVGVARFGEIARRECATDVDCTCGPWWDDFIRETVPDGGVEELDGGTCGAVDAGLDAGSRDASAFDAGTTAEPAPAGCGCTIVGLPQRGPARASVLGVMMTGLAVALRCARRSRSSKERT